MYWLTTAFQRFASYEARNQILARVHHISDYSPAFRKTQDFHTLVHMHHVMGRVWEHSAALAAQYVQQQHEARRKHDMLCKSAEAALRVVCEGGFAPN
jgi:hypothetical protein